ncbi:chemotaxis protein CheW [Caballeronia sordidicola]|uniref:Chemotaxis protein CheW n=1 Tax=Caballeronia sordidicola TaxID=196367 RepID=A0A158GNI0_CABSO|nr:chemotaxis protein CheW [Caballeronia sordidicola]SAL32950.1 chemotaxis protein CheW [Caballeronia sordidicola]
MRDVHAPVPDALRETAGAAPIDDCWNRIGVRGDGSCSRLPGHVHCRNCPVHDAAAARVLDRERTVDREIENQPPHSLTTQPFTSRTAREADTTSWLVFRIGEEWLGLPTAIFQQVAQLRPIHSLPHRRHRAVLGVVNIRGALLVCASLARLFGIESEFAQDGRREGSQQAVDARDLARLLVVEPAADGIQRGELANPTVFPVDAVDGVHRFARADFQEVPATIASMSASHAIAVTACKGVTVGLLDAAKLFETLNRSLT